MAKQKDLICIPESRGLLSKIAEIWPAVGKLFRKNLERKGAESIKKFAQDDFYRKRNCSTCQII